MNKIVAFLKDESGASAAEYAVILAVIGVLLFGAVELLSTNIASAINDAANTIKPPATPG